MADDHHVAGIAGLFGNQQQQPIRCRLIDAVADDLLNIWPGLTGNLQRFKRSRRRRDKDPVRKHGLRRQKRAHLAGIHPSPAGQPPVEIGHTCCRLLGLAMSKQGDARHISYFELVSKKDQPFRANIGTERGTKQSPQSPGSR